ncbi:hypothetical protein SAMN02745245_01047 [Anaerosphaera aminiphila DSM 21120]|uniref:Alpha/beta hydrolase family protein n=1 Tax=Anaerosphaera aminiphila DSM 21120 TaxID=1120995 RepID=A0A1M5RZM9_9FIRM|nr:hypothetical protein [Anaerosphaera aminiphila]SHH31273.1 hypothetical protein SAMN02745245_01047 [Anaerosphaera aminiphila DSM 21120]
MKGGIFPHFTFCMKVDNIIIKIYTKLKIGILKVFGETKKSYEIIKLIISLIISSALFHYLVDYKVPKIVAFLLLSLLFYILISICTYIGKILLVLIKRFHSRNIILFTILFILLYKIFEDVSYDADFENILNFLIPLSFAVIIFIFSKSLVSVFRNKKKAPILLLIPSGAVMAISVVMLISPGMSEKSGLVYSNTGDKSLETEVVYSSDFIDYGSKDENTISLLPYVNYSGKTKKIRDFMLGKELNSVPLKGKIWYPENKKNSPVVFMVHGNHRFTEENYLGYNYLGRYLARRGITVVSVDMNMLNGFMNYGLKNENDARAILLLENIKYILKENKDKNSNLYGLIDEKNIALAGHSRGGEAVSIAQSFNKLKFNPDSGKEMNYNFNIKGVIAISPTVDQYNPSDKNIVMKDTNFLAIHGTHDGDVTGFSGMKLYNNTLFSENSNNFKSAVYVGYANHGQFNSLWGDADSEPPEEYFINKAALLDEKVQEDILCKYVYSFLENSFGLKNDRGLFKNPTQYKLPETLYYSRYSDSSFKSICNFNEDYNMETFTFGKSRFEGLTSVKEKSVKIGGFSTEDTGLCLDSNGKGKYELIFDKFVQPKNFLQFDLMSLDTEENFEDTKFKVALVDSFGNREVVDISKYLELKPEIKVELSKLQDITKNYDYKSSYETVRIPMEDFSNQLDINLSEIKYLEFVFDGGSSSSIVIDNIGYSN